MNLKEAFGGITLGVVLTLAAASASPARAAVSSQAIGNNTPGFVKFGTHVGATAAATVIDVAIWLPVRNRPGLDALASQVYDPASARYQQWLKPTEFETTFAPTAQDAATVREFFAANGLTVLETGPKNMYVRARGSVAAVNKAFQVQLQDFTLKGRTYYANTTAPRVAGPAGALTNAVYGLHNLQYSHPNLRPLPVAATAAGPATRAAAAAGAAAAAASAPPISAVCFSGPETLTFNNGGTYPFVTAKGNGYAATAEGGICGYTPPEIHTAYNLTNLYKEGFDGTGQTIVIIDWCGSPTIRADANAFAAAYGLPPLTATNFKILNSSTPPTCGAPDVEINIDVEWAHAIAPGANIDLVVPPSASFIDVDTAEFFAIENGLGNVISGSYGSEEAFNSPAEVATENLINEIAAVQGISATFSSGDYGDFTFGFPQFNPASVSVPADSPYATAVGGVSLALNTNKTIAWQTGWGTNVTELDSGGFVFDPPIDYSFFDFGSGGGPSAVFGKPAYQSKLKGTARLLPDISWLADPYTGGVIAISEPFQFPPLTYQVYGGTSLACPMFAALWAIANQEAGHALGQAATYLYSMPASTITDVLPHTSATNVTATYKESATVTDVYTASDLAGPLESTTKFTSALWSIPLEQDTYYVLTFGTDSGLTVGTGWDNVTGLGTPNAKAFADYFNPSNPAALKP